MAGPGLDPNRNLLAVAMAGLVDADRPRGQPPPSGADPIEGPDNTDHLDSRPGPKVTTPVGAPVDLDRVREQAASLVEPPILFVPIRHHSPACAHVVQALIETYEPWAVLVEGPPSFDDQLPLLVHPEARFPLAVHSYAVFPARTEPGEPYTDSPGPPVESSGPAEYRAGFYYPLCDYSPELVALRAGAAIGAHMKFVDLDYVDLARYRDVSAGHTDESIYGFSAALGVAAQRVGCRDHNELWDQMVETTSPRPGSPAGSLAGVVSAVLAYATVARSTTTDEQLRADGTHAREAAMAQLIAGAELDRRASGADRPLLVVTGAFHTVALPGLVDQALTNDGTADLAERPPGQPAVTDTEPSMTSGTAGGFAPRLASMDVQPTRSGHGLIRYSFDRLDGLAGYSAGMPSPRWYQLAWDDTDDPVNAVVTDVAARLREASGDGQPSLPSTVDAVVTAEQLGRLRGRQRPARDDVLDAMVTCFTKGEDGPANPVRHLSRVAMTGFDLGVTPPGCPRPPLADDFDRLLVELGLGSTTSEPRRVDLDVYRSERDRRRSRFLHGVTALDVTFAQCVSPLRFSRSRGRDLVRERWTIQLTGATDADLTEAALWGANVTQAVEARTRAQLEEMLATQPGAASLMGLVLTAAQRGVRSIVAVGLDEIRRRIAHDPSLVELARALSEADLLWTAREPLGGPELDGLTDIAVQLFARSCQLANRLNETPEGEWTALATALDVLYRVATTGPWPDLDTDLLLDAIDEQVDLVPPGTLRGALAGLAWRAGRRSDTELAMIATSHLDPTAEADLGPAMLAGLVMVARDALWEVPSVIEAMHGALATYDDDEFLERVPGWRSALSSLTPRQTDRLAEAVTKATGVRAPRPVHGIDQTTVLANTARSVAAARQLADDGLGHWLSRADQ